MLLTAYLVQLIPHHVQKGGVGVEDHALGTELDPGKVLPDGFKDAVLVVELLPSLLQRGALAGSEHR
ncbi:hypothetical protein [Halopseudomonas maritima]|uniref:hypothetical protein n=1 Tax=Halopseudomonas maritima TaxID=2918528 RepID=UPI001EEA123F